MPAFGSMCICPLVRDVYLCTNGDEYICTNGETYSGISVAFSPKQLKQSQKLAEKNDASDHD